MANTILNNAVNKQVVVDYGDVNGEHLPSYAQITGDAGEKYITNSTFQLAYNIQTPYFFNNVALYVGGIPEENFGETATLNRAGFLSGITIPADRKLATVTLEFRNAVVIKHGISGAYNDRNGQIPTLSRRTYQLRHRFYADQTMVDPDFWVNAVTAERLMSEFLQGATFSLAKLINKSALKQMVNDLAHDGSLELNPNGVLSTASGKDIMDLIAYGIETLRTKSIEELSVEEDPTSNYMCAVSQKLYRKIIESQVYEARTYLAMGNVSSSVATEKVSYAIMNGEYTIIQDKNLDKIDPNLMIFIRKGCLSSIHLPIEYSATKGAHGEDAKQSMTWLLANGKQELSTDISTGIDGSFTARRANEDSMKPLISIFQKFDGELEIDGPFKKLQEKVLVKVTLADSMAKLEETKARLEEEAKHQAEIKAKIAELEAEHRDKLENLKIKKTK